MDLPRIENRGVLEQIHNRIKNGSSAQHQVPTWINFSSNKSQQNHENEFHKIFITFEIQWSVSDDRFLKLNYKNAVWRIIFHNKQSERYCKREARYLKRDVYKREKKTVQYILYRLLSFCSVPSVWVNISFWHFFLCYRLTINWH